jgi:hypothetical protein
VQAKTLAGLQVEKASIEGQHEVAEADLRPVRYLATLMGAKDDVTMMCCDISSWSSRSCSTLRRYCSFWPRRRQGP